MIRACIAKGPEVGPNVFLNLGITSPFLFRALGLVLGLVCLVRGVG